MYVLIWGLKDCFETLETYETKEKLDARIKDLKRKHLVIIRTTHYGDK